MGSQPTRWRVVMVVVEHRQRFAKRRRDEAVELRRNERERERERGAKGLVYPLGRPSPLYIGGGAWETSPPSPRVQLRGRGLGLQFQSYSY